MIKNIIFDYNGVLAKLNFKKMLKHFHLSEKFKAHRLITGYKKNQEIKECMNLYKEGKISEDDLYITIENIYPKSVKVLPKMLSLIPECLEENKQLLDVIAKLHNKGVKIIMLSNSTPEVESKIEVSPLVNHFDGFVLSHKVEMKKPNRDIYEFTCNFYDLIPSETLFVDDSSINLASAKKFGIKVMLCDDIKSIADRVYGIFYSKYIHKIEENSDNDNHEKFDNNKSRD